jgi:hypothetical protein
LSAEGSRGTIVASLTIIPVRLIEAIAFAGIRLSISFQSIESQNGECGNGGKAHGAKVMCPVVDSVQEIMSKSVLVMCWVFLNPT